MIDSLIEQQTRAISIILDTYFTCLVRVLCVYTGCTDHVKLPDSLDLQITDLRERYAIINDPTQQRTEIANDIAFIDDIAVELAQKESRYSDLWLFLTKVPDINIQEVLNSHRWDKQNLLIKQLTS